MLKGKNIYLKSKYQQWQETCGTETWGEPDKVVTGCRRERTQEICLCTLVSVFPSDIFLESGDQTIRVDIHRSELKNPRTQFYILR